MRTNSKAYHEAMKAHILGGIYDFTGPDDEASRARHIWARFHSEYNYADNIKRTPNTQARVAEWLAGLPLNIAYANGDILEWIEQTTGQTLSERRADAAISGWFSHVAFHLMRAWEAHGINPHKPDPQGAAAFH
jgi:hypothetical protein